MLERLGNHSYVKRYYTRAVIQITTLDSSTVYLITTRYFIYPLAFQAGLLGNLQV